ncbi:hypothetical protein S40285_10421 [Stachybotrys chlorohalonatus IBT 40285]|uniref:Uncharacterized protein n=1 Tax=Stachybotrys chlorohalonatus (strain IBT 40285) TaxID=1283841 RepID=A0A084QEA4_STAC4|nr:hypothetical protein S40285_10421 [Stachybotrys chlorohalonata IBT 40285]
MEDTLLETRWIGEPRAGAPREVTLLVGDERKNWLETRIPQETIAPLRNEGVFPLDGQSATMDWLSDDSRDKVEATSIHENTAPSMDEKIRSPKALHLD